MKFPIKKSDFFTGGVTISFSKRTLLYVVSLRVSVGRQPSLFLTFSWLLVSFRVSFHAVMCEFVSVMILALN